ncbi:sigma factor-like helix-turn-helix DNA-binding protein [Streptomyces sp. NBC_00872]|uniref:sigma-70 region 4 domain-containing protein n=1 Tax=Streptomyces sp. NBC_00872 TaxID=2903686 RepID=UPI003865B967|nr:sigma-70 region 4 domain-containing protein [Streptomyces sp. NBC_00872]
MVRPSHDNSGGGSALSRTDAVRADQRPGELTLSLPLDYMAFCTLHQNTYLRYTRARIGDEEVSRTVVRTALGELALVWPAALRSSCPEAVAWQLLSGIVSAALTDSGAVSGLRSVHRMLPAGPADALLLCRELSLTVKEAAELMGEEEPAVRSRLSMALRSLPVPLDDLTAGTIRPPGS